MRLLREDGGTMGSKEIEVDRIGALTKDRVRMLRILSKGPNYPAELAREMGLPVQTVYYHIRQLEKAGLIDFVDYREKNGGVAKRYSCRSDSFCVILNPKGWVEEGRPMKEVPRLLSPFIRNGHLDAQMVLGSPDPHGRYRARASDLGMLELAMFLGRFASFSFPLYSLDTQLRPTDKERNLILAGGPKVNTVVAEINKDLPIRFDEGNFEVHSTLSGKRYMENIGVVELIPNPWATDKSVLLLGGLNQNGTKAAVLATVEKMDSLEKGNRFKGNVMAKVVEGFDEDGDGIVDAVEILE